MCERMGTIYNGDYISLACFFTQFFYRHDLAGPVDHVGDVPDFVVGRCGLHKCLTISSSFSMGSLKLKPFDLDSFAQLLLFPCMDHVGIILFGHDYLIALLKC